MFFLVCGGVVFLKLLNSTRESLRWNTAPFFVEQPRERKVIPKFTDVRLCREKSALRPVKTRNDTCIVDKVNCAGCKIGPQISYHILAEAQKNASGD